MSTTTAVKHWARYYLPGSFFAEDSAVELPDRSTDAAVSRAPASAFAFVLYDTAICDFEFDAGLFKVVPIPQNESAKHYIGGTVYTCDELRALAVAEGNPDKYRILISNVTRYVSGDPPVEGRTIRCRTGNWQPFEDGDVLVDAPGERT
jgi:hypothetical protein